MLKRSVEAIVLDWMWVRAALVALSVAVAYVAWVLAFHAFRPSGTDLKPQSVDVFTIGALAFGVFSAVVGALNWAADPNPTIAVGRTITFDRPDHADSSSTMRFTVPHLAVTLRDVPAWMRPLALRPAPEGCEVRLTYLDAATNTPSIRGGPVLARWNENPEPVDYAENRFDLAIQLANRRLRKMYPFGEAYAVPVVVKLQDESDCYHFNDESYRFDKWQNPDWAIKPGRHRIDVTLIGYRMVHPVRASFILLNDGDTVELARVDREPESAPGRATPFPAERDADVLLELAESRVDSQLRDVDALDAKLVGLLGIATAIVTIGLALLTVGNTELPRAATALAYVVGSVYVMNVGCFIPAYWVRRWSYGPELTDARSYAADYDLRMQRWWAAETFENAWRQNQQRYQRKVTLAKALFVGLLLEVACYSAAVVVAIR